MTPSIGVIVNPVAGVGGPAGLKGSDGAEIQAAAITRGSSARAEGRAADALALIGRMRPGAHVLTAADSMGEDASRAAGLTPDIVYRPAAAETSGRDTTAAATALAHAGARLILFAGGDGTARDVCDALLGDTAVLGVPAGVKMYSGCFAVSPVAAGAVAASWMTRGKHPVAEVEVLDVDEEQIRHGRVDPTLYGMVRIPIEPGRTQARKSPTGASQLGAVRSAAAGVVERMRPGVTYLLGPGGTISEVATLLGVEGTPLGVDVVRDGALVLADASERELLALVDGRVARAVLTVIGGQGFLLGRGNQQISAAVLEKIGDDPLIVVATEEKLIDLGGRPLLVDTGDPDLDMRFEGYAKVVTGTRTTSLYPVLAPESKGTS